MMERLTGRKVRSCAEYKSYNKKSVLHIKDEILSKVRKVSSWKIYRRRAKFSFFFEQKYSQSCGRLENESISFTEGLSFFCEKYEKFVELVYSPCKKKNKQFVAKRLKRVKNRCFRMMKIRWALMDIFNFSEKLKIWKISIIIAQSLCHSVNKKLLLIFFWGWPIRMGIFLEGWDISPWRNLWIN